MNPIKFNPDNALVKQIDGHWAKLCALLVNRFGETINTSDGHRHVFVKIEMQDLVNLSESFNGEIPTIVLQEIEGNLTLVVEPASDAKERARRGGSL